MYTDKIKLKISWSHLNDNITTLKYSLKKEITFTEESYLGYAERENTMKLASIYIQMYI